MEILLKEKPNKPFDYSDADVELLARTLYGEARDQGEEGMTAVGNVVLNRLNKKSWYGDSIEEIIKMPYQFSVFNPETKPGQFEKDDNYNATMSATVDDPNYIAAREIALGLLEGKIKDNTDGATHYYNPDEANPTWIDSPKMKSLKIIGKHSFYLEG